MNKEASFYLYDHLEEQTPFVKTETWSERPKSRGNTRIVYSPTKYNPYFAEDSIVFVADYFPYGKILREFVNGQEERFLTTQHERDRETGLDYRGARYYDSDIARFLSLDPLANQFPEWSAYNYVLGNPIRLIDPTGKSPDDWIKTDKGEYVWDNTVTNPSQAHEGQTYIGKEDKDIVKDLFGQTGFTAETWDGGITGMESGPGYVASSKARVFTSLTVSIRANVTYDGDNRTFNGLDFYASSEGTTYAPLPYNKQMAFTATEVQFHGVDMNPLPPRNPIVKAPAGSGTFMYSWSSQRIRNDFGKSYDRKISLKGQYTFGGTPLMDYWSGTVPNTTAISLTIPYNNK